MDNTELDEGEKSAYDELVTEMKTSKPRCDIFLPLMKNTFLMRRHGMMHTFSMEWKMKWVAGIIGYCRRNFIRKQRQFFTQ